MMRSVLFFTILLFVVIVAPLGAQSELEPDDVLIFGEVLSGTLNDRNVRDIFTFDGLRGEVLTLDLTPTSGDLDPVVTVFDNNGALLTALDDSSGSRGVSIESLRIPQSDRYFVVVGRFAYDLGSTAGDYDLSLERVGVSSASGSSLRYGDQVINSINNMAPQLYYSFRAQRGDIISIEMKRVAGNLDPYLQVVDSNAVVVAENDDIFGASSLDAAIESLIIEETGTYIIVASRFGQAAGISNGSFVLSVDETDNSGFGNAPQTAIPALPGQVLEGELTNEHPAKFYVIEARRNDLLSIQMDRLGGGNLDAFLTLTNAGLQPLIEDDDSGNGQNARIERFVVPADGVYYIFATRFEGEGGTTSGRYRLQIQSLGNAFDGVTEDAQRITYGTTVTGRIDDTTPRILYAFFGTEGDTITVSMNRGDGDLDPVIAILNEDQRPIISNDDGGGGQNARIERFPVPRTGLYYVLATRFAGEDGDANTEGSFILVLARRFN